MDGFDLSVVQTLSIAGSTFAVGITLGWILALFYIGSISTSSDHNDKED